jgi:PAS domain S-box-containing protein
MTWLDRIIMIWDEKAGRPLKFIGAATDITERKRTEEEIAKFKTIADIASYGVAIGPIEKLDYVNRSFAEMHGYSPDELIGKHYSILYTEEQLPVINRLRAHLLKTGSFINKEVWHKRKDGTLFPTLMAGSLIRDKEGKPSFIAGTVLDITERKRAEEALRESEEKYRSMMESMKDETYICLSDFRIQYMNPATVSRIGRDATGELCYKTIYGLDEQCSWCVFDKILQGEYVEYELLNPNNNRYYSISNSPIRHTDSSISKLTICRDITDVKKMELQLQQDHKMKIIGTLAGGIAHQFNNDLYVITGNIDLLEMDFPSDENVANYAKEMKASARQMTHLAAQLLAYARGGKYQAKTVSLSNFVKETLSLVKHTIDSAIDVDTDLPRDILNVKGDLTQMQMVMSAVMTNASEAMEGKGRIQVACRNTIITDETVGGFPGLTPGNYVNLTIADDGKGMDEETRNRIFEPFFTTKFEGRGLGMAAAYGIVKNHDGWISVDSELGKGTTVKIYLPAIENVQIRPAAGLPAVETPAKEDSKPKTELIKGTGTILVIEDEEPVMKVSRIILEKMGYSVLEAKTGQEAVDVVKTFDGHIDLALLDILMPDMNGNDIYPLIMEARPDLKVIVFSGYSIDGPAREILNAGAEDFIQKPFAMADLSEKLKKILGDGQ